MKRRAAILGYLILFAGSLLTYVNGQRVSERERGEIRHSARVVAISTCNDLFDFKEEVRLVLRLARRSAERQYEEGIYTETQRDRVLEFYDERLAAIHLPDCRLVDDALEDADAPLPPIPPAKHSNPGG